jgi:hypothetical protein
MVGTQLPKSRAALAPLLLPALLLLLLLLLLFAGAAVGATTTVVRVLTAPQLRAAVVAAAAAVVVAAAAPPLPLPAFPPAGAAPTEPSEPWSVKLEKPLAMATSATLRPLALNGFARDLAELAFSTSEPPTAGSTRGTMPRSSGVAGRLASEQRAGMEAAKGLKFFSAATRAAAPAMTWGSLPRVATILSASSS